MIFAHLQGNGLPSQASALWQSSPVLQKTAESYSKRDPLQLFFFSFLFYSLKNKVRDSLIVSLIPRIFDSRVLCCAVAKRNAEVTGGEMLFYIKLSFGD